MDNGKKSDIMEFIPQIKRIPAGSVRSIVMIEIGHIIKTRREELGVSQEDLAEGVCSTATLSRIERSERLPTQAHLELLLQRLGYTDLSLMSFQSKGDILLHDLKFQVRQAYIEKDLPRAKNLLGRYEREAGQPPNPIDWQFILLYRALIYREDYTGERRLAVLEEALRQTHPSYDGNTLPLLLSYEEIVVVNSIALWYKKAGDRKRGIEILYALRDYYDKHIVNLEEALRTEGLILYNLSSMLGLEGRYRECIEVCEQGIRLARTTGRCGDFGGTLYNYAWALVKQGRPEDREKARTHLRHAIHVAQAMGDEELAAHCIRFARENFPGDDSLS